MDELDSHFQKRERETRARDHERVKGQSSENERARSAFVEFESLYAAVRRFHFGMVLAGAATTSRAFVYGRTYPSGSDRRPLLAGYRIRRLANGQDLCTFGGVLRRVEHHSWTQVHQHPWGHGYSDHGEGVLIHESHDHASPWVVRRRRSVGDGARFSDNIPFDCEYAISDDKRDVAEVSTPLIEAMAKTLSASGASPFDLPVVEDGMDELAWRRFILERERGKERGIATGDWFGLRPANVGRLTRQEVIDQIVAYLREWKIQPSRETILSSPQWTLAIARPDADSFTALGPLTIGAKTLLPKIGEPYGTTNRASWRQSQDRYVDVALDRVLSHFLRSDVFGHGIPELPLAILGEA